MQVNFVLDDYDKAIKMAVLAQETSNLESDDELKQRKRKLPNRFLRDCATDGNYLC